MRTHETKLPSVFHLISSGHPSGERDAFSNSSGGWRLVGSRSSAFPGLVGDWCTVSALVQKMHHGCTVSSCTAAWACCLGVSVQEKRVALVGTTTGAPDLLFFLVFLTRVLETCRLTKIFTVQNCLFSVTTAEIEIDYDVLQKVPPDHGITWSLESKTVPKLMTAVEFCSCNTSGCPDDAVPPRLLPV